MTVLRLSTSLLSSEKSNFTIFSCKRLSVVSHTLLDQPVQLSPFVTYLGLIWIPNLDRQ